MLTIKIPIWISSAYVTMCITSLPGSANRLPYLAAPAPIIPRSAGFVNFCRGLPPPCVEVCRFLSENKSAGAIDKPAQQEYAVVNKDARSWLQRTFLESHYGLRPRRLKSYKRRGLPFAGTEKTALSA